MNWFGACFALGIAAWPTFAQAEPPDLILHHAKIVTVDKQFSLQQAIAVEGNQIVKVGSNDEVLALQGEKTKLIDLQGKMLLPGLMDSHTHPTGASLHEFDHPIPEMETIQDVLNYIKSRADALDDGQWIQVRQVFITRLREQRYPTKAELDRVAPQNPVVFSTGPDAMLNSLALKESGIDRDFQVTGPGMVEKDAAGEPTGMLRSCGHYIKSKSSVKQPNETERLARLEQLFRDYNSVGLTAVADRSSSSGAIASYVQLLNDNRLTVRVAISHHINNTGRVEAIQKAIREVAEHKLRKADDPRLRIVGIKTFLDGGMLTGSAYMREPWGVSEIYSITDPQYRGVLFMQRETLLPIVQTTVECGLQFTAHSVGDGAVHSLLDVYEEVNRTLPIRNTRPCITHSNFMSKEAVEQAARLGVVHDIQPAWLYLDTRTLTAQFGYDRLRYFQPLASIFAAGGIAGGGSDHMQKIGSLRAVNPYNPFLGMWVTMARQGRWYEGRLHPEEALSREQAIRFYTMNNATILFLDQQAGSLEPGKLADFIVVDRDLLTCPLDDVRDAQVLQTYLDGKLVFERKAK